MASLSDAFDLTGRADDLPFHTRPYVTPSQTTRTTCEHPAPFNFRVMTYNLLADYLLQKNPYLYTHLRTEYLVWEYRRNNLKREILHYRPSVLCLQEAEENHFRTDILPSLESEGYALAAFKKRTGSDKTDGVAILFLKSMFSLVGVAHTIEMNRPGNPVLDRDNVACIARLRPVCLPKGMQAGDVIVATTHLLFNPRRGDIKLAQIDLVCQEIASMLMHDGDDHSPTATAATTEDNVCNSKAHTPPGVIICGDFNSSPGSLVYNFLRRGNTGDLSGVDYRHVSGRFAGEQVVQEQEYLKTLAFDRDTGRAQGGGRGGWHKKKIGSTFPVGTIFSHSLGELCSLYDQSVKGDASGEPWCTSYSNFKNQTSVDYIFFNNQLSSNGFFSVPSLENLDAEGGIPNRCWSSDHVSLVGDFCLEPRSSRSDVDITPLMPNMGATDEADWPTLGGQQMVVSGGRYIFGASSESAAHGNESGSVTVALKSDQAGSTVSTNTVGRDDGGAWPSLSSSTNTAAGGVAVAKGTKKRDGGKKAWARLI